MGRIAPELSICSGFDWPAHGTLMRCRSGRRHRQENVSSLLWGVLLKTSFARPSTLKNPPGGDLGFGVLFGTAPASSGSPFDGRSCGRKTRLWLVCIDLLERERVVGLRAAKVGNNIGSVAAAGGTAGAPHSRSRKQ